MGLATSEEHGRCCCDPAMRYCPENSAFGRHVCRPCKSESDAALLATTHENPKTILHFMMLRFRFDNQVCLRKRS